MMLRRAVAALALFAALTLPAASVVAQSPDVIRIGAGPVDQAAPLVYGVKAGIYKKYGLAVEVVKLANGAAIASAVAGGSLEMGQSSALAAITAIAKGLPFTVVGNLASYDAEKPDFALLVAAGSPIKAPADLEGKTLAAVSLQDQASIFTFAWMDAHGVDRSSIKYAEIPASAALAAMDQGRIVGATVYEPYYTGDVASGRARILGYPYEAIGKRFSTAVIFTSQKWASEHGDALTRFLKASQEASLYVGAHEAETAPLLAEYTGVDPAALGNMRHALRGIPIAASDVQPVIDAAAKYKIIPKAFPASDMICGCALRR